MLLLTNPPCSIALERKKVRFGVPCRLVLTVAYMLYMLTLKKITLSLIQLAYMQEICQRLLKLV